MDVRKLVIRIPGQWDDAWLYREQLLVWDRHGQLYSLGLDQVRRAIAAATDHHLSVLAEHLVLRSARKTMGEFLDALEIESVRREFFHPLESRPESLVELADLSLNPASIEGIPGHLTDTVVYGNRLFATSDSGVYETEFDSRYDERSPLLAVTSAPATAVVAGNGQFAASLGEQGLIARGVGFGDGSDWARAAEAEPISTLAPYSRSVTRSSIHLLNYGEDELPEFIVATAHREQRANGFTEAIITDFGKPESIRETVLSTIGHDHAIAGADDSTGVEVLGNAGYRLLVRRGLQIDVLNLRASQTKGLVVQRDRRRGRINIRPERAATIRHALATHQLHSGFLVEHTGGAHVLTDDGVVEIANELAVQVRTFPNSRRYGDTVVLIREASLDLVGFVNLGSDGGF